MGTALEDGGVDVLVNNVGAVRVRLEGFASVSDEDWLRTWNLTFMAAVRTTRAALPAMLQSGSGTIVNIVSVNSFLPDPAVIDYQAVARAQGASPQEIAAHQASEASTGRFSTPEEVADLVVVLAGDRAANVTGADFVIDGGLIQTI